MKRLFDVISSLIVLLLFLPFGIIVSLLIKLDSHGPVFFLQERVGKNEKPFFIFKFRTMTVSKKEKDLQITVGNDSRITRIGKVLRKYKIDELPQLINVLKGEMSVVGPRPEVPKYVHYYTQEQKKVLRALPGITDLASIEFINENDLLGKVENPETYYIEEILPTKLNINLQYTNQRISLFNDIKIILKTLKRIIW